MSNQSGIIASDSLKSFFGSCRDGSVRCFKVVLTETPSLDLGSKEHKAQGDWENDWDKMVPGEIDHDSPCFVFYRLDERDTTGNFRWILLAWSPDHASVRQKMLYASTKVSLKQEFGMGQIKEDYYANMREDVKLSGYKRHLAQGEGPGPLSREEEELREFRQMETRPDIGVDSKQQTLARLAFPFSKEALSGIETYWKKGYDYLQLAVDLDQEVIVMGDKCSSCSVDQLREMVPKDKARYHLFRFKHIYENNPQESNVFVYSMPGYSVSIKERMLYSSCKNSVVEVIDKVYSIPIAKKIEVDNADELTESFLMEEIHPVECSSKPKFSKPVPPSRGNRRITKTPKS